MFSSKESIENLIESDVSEELQDVGDKSHHHENDGDVEEDVGDESRDYENSDDVEENVGDDHIDVEENIESPEHIFHLNIYHPKVWDGLNAEMRDILVERGAN